MQEILAAVIGKIGQPKPCPLCGQTVWSISDMGYLTFVASERPLENQLQGDGFPSVVFICRHCGNTMFFNMYALGLGDLIKRLNPAATETVPQDPPSEPPTDG
jgi:hypothetical protein